jgi:hypothetical protein
MPRRRMIDPSFWTDSDVRTLTRDERLFFMGCISNADDEGRLLAHPAYLKAAIFMYDDDLNVEQVKKMRDSILSKMRNLVLYECSEEEYLTFLKWNDYQKPSHAKPSKIPPPPLTVSPATSSDSFHDTVTDNGNDSVSEGVPSTFSTIVSPSQGQSSQGKKSTGKESITKVKVSSFDFKSKNDNDLTAYLTTLLTENIAQGSQWATKVITEFWQQFISKPDSTIFEGALKAIKKYPPEVIAKALFKGMKHGAGKHQTWKYIEPILEEEQGKLNG